MKKIFLFSLVALLAILSTSCSSGIKPADPPITYGSDNNEYWQDINVRDCYEIQSCGVAITDIQGLLCNLNGTVTIKTIKTPDWPKGKEIMGEAIIEVLNKDNTVIASHQTYDLNDLFNSQEGDVATITVRLKKDYETEEAEKIVKDAKYIRVSKLNIRERIKDIYGNPI